MRVMLIAFAVALVLLVGVVLGVGATYFIMDKEIVPIIDTAAEVINSISALDQNSSEEAADAIRRVLEGEVGKYE